MASFNDQLEVVMISRGPSMTVIESQLEAIAMAIFDGQFEVVMSLWGPSMIAFDGQFKVVILSL